MKSKKSYSETALQHIKEQVALEQYKREQRLELFAIWFSVFTLISLVIAIIALLTGKL